MSSIHIPAQLADAFTKDGCPARQEWLEGLPRLVCEVASEWALELDEPYVPGGRCAWVAPARNAVGDRLALKLGWRHREAEHEAEGLWHWDGDGVVRCFAARQLDNTTALLLERCTPGQQLRASTPEQEQDEIIAQLLRRLWARVPSAGNQFASLAELCGEWADAFVLAHADDRHGLDPGLAREAADTLRALPTSAGSEVLLCTDLHAGNVLSTTREPWLVIDPKPLIGDPAFDPVQHILNCRARLLADASGLVQRMAGLLDLDVTRVRLWLFARCAQESPGDPTMRELAQRLAP